MSTTYVNPASNISYVSKDFQTVFPDLINLAKQISSRWDPSISNESDPGVVLVKLNAIIADKLNYNIDKNILEAFPMSLTQLSSARKIYSMLGYRMAWYKSSQCNVNLTWIGDISEDDSVTIPAFTMITDDTSSLVYSLIQTWDSTDTDISTSLSPKPMKLPYTGSTVTVRAIQGTAVNYNINGEELIQASNLDSENRLYFSTTDVAENGIFICNEADEEDRVYDWKRVDNLLIEKLDNKYFEFGITDDGYSCYIEFPEDAEELIKDGIRIVYLRTSGETGNIATNVLNKFYSDTYLTDSTDTQVTLSTTNVTIANASVGVGGENPESINSAYKSYKQVVGTFDTLITIRDYINAILRSDLVSNGFVCDKTNDIQSSYTVKAVVNGIDTDRIYIENIETTSGTTKTISKAIGSLNIKLYLLEKVDTMKSSTYATTFDLIPEDQQDAIRAYIDEKKHIGHDYSDILITSFDSARPCMFINKYAITARIQTKEVLTDDEKTVVKDNIVQNLCDCLNASEVEFGETITIDRLKTIIAEADSNVKTVNIDDLDYTTYAKYYYKYIKCTNSITDTKEETVLFSGDGEKTVFELSGYTIGTPTSCKSIAIDNKTISSTEYDFDPVDKKIVFHTAPKNGVSINIKLVTTVENACGGKITYDEWILNNKCCPHCNQEMEWPDDTAIYNAPVYDFAEVAIGKKDDVITDAISDICVYSAGLFDKNKTGGYLVGDLVKYNTHRFRCKVDGAKIAPYLKSPAWELDEYDVDVDYNTFITKLSKGSDENGYDGALEYDRAIKLTYIGEENVSDVQTSSFICEASQTEFQLPITTTEVDLVKNQSGIIPATQYTFDTTTKILTLTTAQTEGMVVDVIYTIIIAVPTWSVSNEQKNHYQISNGNATQIIDSTDNIESIKKLTYTYNSETITLSKYEFDAETKTITFDSTTETIPPQNSKLNIVYILAADKYTTAELATEYGITFISGTPGYNSLTETGDTLLFYISKGTQIRDEVMAKSILAGKTALIEDDETAMDYNFTYPFCNTYPEIQKISGETSLVLTADTKYIYNIFPNEVAEFYAPEFFDIAEYGSYVKFEAKLNRNLSANACTQLQPGEYIVFYSRPTENASGIYIYHAYGEGAIICPSIEISKDTTHEYADNILPILTSSWRVVSNGGHKYLEATTTYNGAMLLEQSNAIANKLTSSSNVLNSDAKTIYIKSPTQVALDSSFYCYWILNTSDSRAILFEKGESEKILGNGEYFIYTTAALQNLEILGQGTKITRTNITDEVSVSASITIESLLTGGLSIISGNLYNPTYTLTCTKNQTLYLGSSCSIKLEPRTEDAPRYICFYKDGTYKKDTESAEWEYDNNVLLNFDILYNGSGETDFPNKLDYISITDETLSDDGTLTSSTLGWRGLSILQLNLSSTIGQTLYSNQVINLKDITYEEVDGIETGLTQIEGSDKITKTIPQFKLNNITFPTYDYPINIVTKAYAFNQSPCVLFADSEIYLSVSGDYTLTRYVNLTETEYGTISKAKQNFISTTPAITPLSNGSVILSILPTIGSTTGQYNTIVYPMQLAAGDYLSRFTSSSTETSHVFLYLMHYLETNYTVQKEDTPQTLIIPVENATQNLVSLLINNEEIDRTYYTYTYDIDSSTGNVSFIITELVTFYAPGKVTTFSLADSTKGYITACKDVRIAPKTQQVATFTGDASTTTFNLSTQISGDIESCVSVTINDTVVESSLYELDTTTKTIVFVNAPDLDTVIKITLITYTDPATQPEYTFNLTTNTITFTTAPAAEARIKVTVNTYRLSPITGDNIRIAVNQLARIEDSYFTIASNGLTSDNTAYNLNGLSNTPVKFTIPTEYDPTVYVLPIFLSATIVLNNVGLLSATETITLTNPKKYVQNSDFTELEYTKYGLLLKKFDNIDDEPLFNYMYEINDNEAISNPLLPTSFLNYNHPFYKYTICEFLVEDTTGIEILESSTQ